MDPRLPSAPAMPMSDRLSRWQAGLGPYLPPTPPTGPAQPPAMPTWPGQPVGPAQPSWPSQPVGPAQPPAQPPAWPSVPDSPAFGPRGDVMPPQPAWPTPMPAPAPSPFDFAALDKNADGYLSGSEIAPDLAAHAYRTADGRMILTRDRFEAARRGAPAPAPYAPAPAPYAPPPPPAPYAPPVPTPYGPQGPQFGPPPAPPPYAPAPQPYPPQPYAPAPQPYPPQPYAPTPQPYGPGPRPLEASPHDTRESWFMCQYGGPSNPNEDVISGNANCGPTCVAMIAKAFGKINPSAAEVDDAIEKARAYVGQSQNERVGTSCDGLDRALEKYGLTSQVMGNASAATIQRELAKGRLVIANIVPCYLGSSGGGHFAVVTRIEGDKVYLNDPAVKKGPMVTTVRQLERAIAMKGSYAIVSAGPR